MSSGFVSEADLAERRRVRQAEWEKKRKEGDPSEPPEEPSDNRCLYEQLQEQRQKKQEEWEEAQRLKNMVRGLEDDEVDFLDLVDRTKLEAQKRVRSEEETALFEYRKKVSEMAKKAAEEEIAAELRPEQPKASSSVSSEGKKHSQVALLSGAIKRKSDDKRKSANLSDEKHKKNKSEKCDTAETAEATTYVNGHMPSSLKCIAVLPGIGNYTDSSDSDNTQEMTDSDIEDEVITHFRIRRDITGRIIRRPQDSSNGDSSGGRLDECY